MMLLIFGAAASVSRPAIDIEEDDIVSRVRLASITVLINYFALLLMITRFWDCEIFVLPLATPILTALTAKIFRYNRLPHLRRLIWTSWVVLALVLVSIRFGKVATWFVSILSTTRS